MANKQKPASTPTTDTGRALLAQRLEAPDDPATRLVYADWLEQHGPFAHLLEPLAGWTRDPILVDGMIRMLQIQTGTYVKKATQQALLPALTVFGCKTTMLRGQSVKVASSESLAWTTELWWWDCQLDDGGLDTLADSPHLARLSSLVLEKVRSRNAGLEALARSHLPRLRRFGLPSPVHLGDYQAEAVVEVIAAHPIERLILTGVNRLDITALVDAPAAAKLQWLEITTSNVGELSHSEQLTSLEHLRLDTFQRIPDADFARFLDNPVFGRLRSIELGLSHGLSPALLVRFRERFGDQLRYRATTP